MKAFTDYPFSQLGDIPYENAPIRECTVISYDGDKYCIIQIGHKKLSVKAGYLYTEPGRLLEVPTIDVSLLPINARPKIW